MLEPPVSSDPAVGDKEEDDEILDLLRDQVGAVPTAPALNPSLATNIQVIWNRKPLEKSKLKEKLSSVSVPENCTFFIPQKTNPEIFNKALPESTKATDLHLQNVQQMVGRLGAMAED